MKKGNIEVSLQMGDVVDCVLALSAAEGNAAGAAPSLGDGNTTLIASLGWMAVRMALGELQPWLLDVETHGEYTPDGTLTATFRYFGPSVDSTWIADAMKASVINFAAHEAMKTLASAGDTRRVDIHGDSAARLMREMKTTLRGIDLGRRYRLTPHWF